MAGRRLALHRPELTKLGRNRNLDLTLDDIKAFRRTRRAPFTNGAWTIVDLNSSNGTWLNDAKISSSASPLATCPDR